MDAREAINTLNKLNYQVLFLAQDASEDMGRGSIVVSPPMGAPNDDEFLDSFAELIEYAKKVSEKEDN